MKTVDIYATAFPEMYRALEVVIVTGDVVIVQLSLNGTHKGPLVLPAGTVAATKQTIHTPCCDVFRLRDGTVMSFDCYTAATILFAQLGIFGNLFAAVGAKSGRPINHQGLVATYRRSDGRSSNRIHRA